MKSGTHRLLPISDIVLDKDNPRIKTFLEMYPGEPRPEQIQQALGAGIGDVEQDGVPTFGKLKESILTNGGIIQPIIVNTTKGGSLVCVEGNTRVCLYRIFHEQNPQGSWERIPAIVYDQLNEEEIDAIRLQAHLVGPRPWDAYSKAKYLTYLRNKENLPFSKLVDYCGGSTKAVKESIGAFEDMEKYFRPLCHSEGDFDPRRFSGFVELQKNNVKTTILQEGYDVSDFAQWIWEKKIFPLATVRDIPKILKNPKAKEVFLKKGALEAKKLLDRPELSKALQEATIAQLAQALAEAINKAKHSEIVEIQKNPESETSEYLLEASDAIRSVLNSFETQ
jgi:hypothetical protein